MKSPKLWLLEFVVKKEIKKLMEDKSMENVVKLLEGNKTYIAAGLYALVTFLEAAALITPAVATELRNFLLALGLGTLRSGMKK